MKFSFSAAALLFLALSAATAAASPSPPAADSGGGASPPLRGLRSILGDLGGSPSSNPLCSSAPVEKRLLLGLLSLFEVTDFGPRDQGMF